MERFPIPRSRWALPFLVLFAPRTGSVEVHPDRVEIAMGAMGHARVPVALIGGVGRMRWPWWGGVGVRIGKGLVAFAGRPGEAVLLETTEPVAVRAPLRWTTSRIVVVVDRPDHLAAAVAAARQLTGEEPG